MAPSKNSQDPEEQVESAPLQGVVSGEPDKTIGESVEDFDDIGSGDFGPRDNPSAGSGDASSDFTTIESGPPEVTQGE